LNRDSGWDSANSELDTGNGIITVAVVKKTEGKILQTGMKFYCGSDREKGNPEQLCFDFIFYNALLVYSACKDSTF
jgi:hypothetical protein